MKLNDRGEVWKHCCMEWVDPKKELWIYQEDDRVAIYCMEHDVLLGYEDDLPQE
jgi:hypothetical protein